MASKLKVAHEILKSGFKSHYTESIVFFLFGKNARFKKISVYEPSRLKLLDSLILVKFPKVPSCTTILKKISCVLTFENFG